MTGDRSSTTRGGQQRLTVLGCVPAGSGVVVSGLFHSRMFAIAVELYQLHRPGADGRCLRCRYDQCRRRMRAVKIMAAAGVDPDDFYLCMPVTAAPRSSPSRALAASSDGCTGRRRPATTFPRWSWPDPTRPFYRHRTPSPAWNATTNACDVPLHPLKLAGGSRAYRGACGCRMRPIDAATVERQVFNAVEQRAPALVSGVPADCLAEAYRSVLGEVRAGVTGDELTFAWLI